jgi:hypothetical protein
MKEILKCKVDNAKTTIDSPWEEVNAAERIDYRVVATVSLHDSRLLQHERDQIMRISERLAALTPKPRQPLPVGYQQALAKTFGSCAEVGDLEARGPCVHHENQRRQNASSNLPRM